MTYDQGAGFIHLVNLLDHQTESPYVISCSHDENYVAVGTFAGNVYIWHRTSGSKLTTLQGHTQGITALAWSDDGTLLFSASYDGSTRIWDIATGTMLYTLRDTYDNYFMAMVIPGSHAHILNLRYDKHSATIVTGSILGTICFWDTRSGTQLKRCDDHTGSIQALELNRDGTLLASASSDNTVRLWNMRDKRCSHILGHQDGAHALAFSPDSTILATTNGKGTINIWDCATGSLKNSLHGHTDRVETLEFSTDSTRLLSSSRDCTARIWKVKHM
jgi:WD40 repeat protein